MFNLTSFIFICEYDNFTLNMNIFIYIAEVKMTA